MGSFTYVINKKKGDVIHMSFASFVNRLSDTINDSIRAVANSGIIGDTVGKATRVGLNVGKAVGNVGFKVGATGINTGLKGANFIKDNYKEIGKTFANVGKGAAQEANTIAQAGVAMGERLVKSIDRNLLKPAPLNKSLIGRSVNKRGLALIAGGAIVMQGTRDTKAYIDNRQGRNDGQLYRPTPQMSTPYQLSQQMAYSSHGQSYADNAGATGDLVFALNNSRHG